MRKCMGPGIPVVGLRKCMGLGIHGEVLQVGSGILVVGLRKRMGSGIQVAGLIKWDQKSKKQDEKVYGIRNPWRGIASVIRNSGS